MKPQGPERTRDHTHSNTIVEIQDTAQLSFTSGFECPTLFPPCRNPAAHSPGPTT